jgi:UrcA family protein
MRRTKLTVLLVALAAGTTQVALADVFDGAPLSRQVNYSDLDLSQPAGAQLLYRRLVVAADSVCKPFDDNEISRKNRFKACVSKALSAAVADVDRPLLTSYYESKGGVPFPRMAQLDK